MYEKLYDEKEDNTVRATVAFRAGESYRQKNDWMEAERWYQKAIRRNYSDPEVYYQLARVQNLQEDFEDAIENYKKYIENAPGKEERGKEGIERVNRFKKWKSDSTRYVVEEADRLNTRENDYAPSYLGDREELVFTSDRENDKFNDEDRWTGKPFANVYKAKWDRRREYYDDIKLMEGDINTEFNEGVTSFSKRGRKLYYTQCNGPEGEIANCRVMVARRQGGRGYGEPEKLPFCTDSTINYANPSVSRNGKKILLSSNMKGVKVEETFT